MYALILFIGWIPYAVVSVLSFIVSKTIDNDINNNHLANECTTYDIVFHDVLPQTATCFQHPYIEGTLYINDKHTTFRLQKTFKLLIAIHGPLWRTFQSVLINTYTCNFFWKFFNKVIRQQSQPFKSLTILPGIPKKYWEITMTCPGNL